MPRRTVDSLVVQFNAQTKEFRREVRNLNRAVASSQRQNHRATQSMQRSWTRASRGIGKTLASLRTSILGLGAAYLSISGITLFARSVISSTGQQQRAIELLNNALRNTGRYSDETSRKFQKFASERQDVTRFGDETTIEAFSIAARIEQISTETLPQFVALAQDISAATGKDLIRTIRTLGTAFADPEAGLSRLITLGVTFSEGLKDQVKELVAQNRVLEAQQVIFKVLLPYFGAAETEGKTLVGVVGQVKNSFGDLFEITKEESESLGETLKGLTDIFKDETTREAISAFFSLLVDTAKLVLAVVTPIFNVIVLTIKYIYDQVKGVFEVLSDLAKKSASYLFPGAQVGSDKYADFRATPEGREAYLDYSRSQLGKPGFPGQRDRDLEKFLKLGDAYNENNKIEAERFTIGGKYPLDPRREKNLVIRKEEPYPTAEASEVSVDTSEASENVRKLKEESEELERTWVEIGRTADDALISLITGTGSFKQLLQSLVQQLANAFLKAAFPEFGGGGFFEGLARSLVGGFSFGGSSDGVFTGETLPAPAPYSYPIDGVTGSSFVVNVNAGVSEAYVASAVNVAFRQVPSVVQSSIIQGGSFARTVSQA